MKLKTLCCCSALLMQLIFPYQAFSESLSPNKQENGSPYSDGKLEVRYPAFKIQINNNFMDNSISKYPVLLYNGITYFPMTWSFTQALGLQVGWDDTAGFAISRSHQKPDKLHNETAIISAKQLFARLPNFPVRVNDKLIDNDNEEFPVLVFNDVTYFPMTWKFAVEELGLNISFDKNIFSISSEQLNSKAPTNAKQTNSKERPGVKQQLKPEKTLK